MLNNDIYIDSKRLGLWLFISFLVLYAWQILDIPAFARGTSYDKELDITVIRNDCSTVQPIATYSFRNRQVEGILFATSCRDGSELPSPLVDQVKYKFVDTGGFNQDRYYGIVDT